MLATDGYTDGLVPELAAAIKPTRGQVIATEPLERRLFPCPHYARHGYDYWQQTPEGRLIAGGLRDRAPDHEYASEESTTPLIQAALEEFVAELLGEEPVITHRWAGLFGTTADRLPLVGRVPGHDGVWVSAGYSATATCWVSPVASCSDAPLSAIGCRSSSSSTRRAGSLSRPAPPS